MTPESLIFIVLSTCVCMLSRLNGVWVLATPWTVARQAPLSLGFSRQEYWSGLPCPPPGGSSRPKNRTWVSGTAGRFFTDWATREALPAGYHKLIFYACESASVLWISSSVSYFRCRSYVASSRRRSFSDRDTLYIHPLLWHSCCLTWHYFFLSYDWVVFRGIHITRLLYPFISWWTSRLLPCLGCCK